jgi:hypothetical protein
MRNGLLTSWVVLLAVTAVADAQRLGQPIPIPESGQVFTNTAAANLTPSVVGQPIPESAQVFTPTANLPPTPSDNGGLSGPWVNADYLLWWVRSGPSGGPLVTRASAADAVPGALLEPGTRTLFGDAPLDWGTFSGMRIGAGLPIAGGLSLEGSYFLLETRSVNFLAVSDPTGNPIITRPVVNAQTGLQNSYITSFPGVVAGSTAVDAQTHLQGYELNLAANLLNNSALRLDVLGGFRALDLREGLVVGDNLVSLVPGAVTFLGVPTASGSTLTDFDSFGTSNHFYGGQIGGRLTWQEERFSVGLTGKVALGDTQELVLIDGATTLHTPGAASVTVPGGVLTQTSNIARYYRSTFGVVPEGSLDLGYQVTPWLKFTVGYTFLYWNRVARPGSQIDHTVNPALVASDEGFGMGGGPARPGLSSIQGSSFWAQGVTFGLVFQF